MSRTEPDRLTADLAPAQAARTEQRLFEQRGGPRRQAKGDHGRRRLLTDADKVLITVVYQRQICPQTVLSELLEVNTCIGTAIVETARLLAGQKRTTPPAVLRLTSAGALRDFLATDTVPSRPNRLAVLGDPALTGIPREALAALTERLSVRQAAESERRKHRRRGGDRQPGARGGVFHEKITDAERVLATILGLRKVCACR